MGGRRLALVVTVDRYDNPGLGQLAAPAADAKALAEVLGDPDLGGFELDFLHNPTSWTAYEKVDGMLADRLPGDLVLLHFSCHGVKDGDGELYLATTNTVPERLASTAVESAWINRVMQRSRAQRVVLLLDCCYGGAFERGVLVRSGGGIDVGDQFRPDHLGDSRGRVVITASTAMEYAFEGSQLSGGQPAGPSVFTGALVEGIRTGAADRDGDGFVGLDELYDYVYDRVQHYSPQQTPCKWEFGLRGELYVARNPNRRVAPASLPQELLDLLEHPTSGARLAAVHELAVLAAGVNLARAAAARLALGRLTDDDSRRVSASAAEALHDTAVRLPESAIHLRAERGSRRLVAEVAVDGPPLALASSVATSGNGLRARIEAGALHISWSAETGSLDGTITLSGPAGEACLRVTADLPVRTSPLQLATTRPRVWLAAVLVVVASVAALGVRALVSQDSATPIVATGGSAGRPAAITPPASTGKPVAVTTVRVGLDPEGDAVSPDGRTLYVANEGTRTLSVIDTATRKIRANILLPHIPRFTAVSPDGARVYVSMYDDMVTGAGSAVASIDTTSGRVLGTVATGPRPFALTVAPDGRIWVPIHNGARVEIIDGLRMRAVGVVATPPNPHAVAFSGDGSRAYTPDHESDLISVIDTLKGTVIANIAVGHSPHSLAVAPDGRTIAVGNYDEDDVQLVDLATRRVTGPFPVGKSPQSVAFAPDGNHVYVVNEGGNSVSTLSWPDGRVTSTLRVGVSPRAIAVAPDGRSAYVTNSTNDTVTVLRVAR